MEETRVALAHRLVEILPTRPQRGPVGPRLSAQEDRKVPLFGQGILRADGGFLLHLVEELAQESFAVSDGNYNLVGMLTGSPKAVIVVSANHGRQAIRWTKVIDCAGLSVVVGGNAGMRPVSRC